MTPDSGPDSEDAGNGEGPKAAENPPAVEPESADRGSSVPEAPVDLRLTMSVLAALRSVGATYLRRLWPLLVVLSVPAVPVVLMTELASVWPALDPVVVNGAVEPLNSPGTGLWVFLGATLVVALALTPIALGGAVLLGGAALLGRRVTVRDAWRQALRRHLSTLGWLLLLLVWIALVLGLLFTALFVVEAPVGLTVVVLLPPVLYTLPVLVVALPVILLEERRPLRALAVSWQVGRFRRLKFLLFVVLAFGSGYLVRQGLEHLGSLAAAQSVDPLLTMAATALVAVLLAPLWPLLVSAPVVLRDGSTRNLDLVVADRQIPRAGSLPAADSEATPEPAPGPAPRGPVLVAVPLLALAVLLPVAVAPLALWASGTTQVFTSAVEGVTDDEVTLTMEAVGDDVRISAARWDNQLILCDPDCATVEHGRLGRGGALLETDAGLLVTSWREYRHEDREEEDSYDPHDDSGLYLRECGALTLEECIEEVDNPTQVRPFGGHHYETYSAIAPLDEGLVIVSYVRSDNSKAQRFDLADQGGLSVQVCADTACTDPRTVAEPEGVSAGAFLRNGMFLDVAVSPEDGFAVTVYDGNHGGLNLVRCPDAECARPEVTEVVPGSVVTEYEGYLAPRFGARVEYRPDGTPVVAYRAAQGGAAHVVDCHDAACAEFTDRAVTGPGWARPAPGLAVDSHGNPQLATFDMDAERLVLVSCLDAGCTETATVPLRGFEDEPALTALALDEADRPHLVWAEGTPDLWSTRDFTATTEYVRCLEPRCGADGTAPDPATDHRAAGLPVS